MKPTEQKRKPTLSLNPPNNKLFVFFHIENPTIRTAPQVVYVVFHQNLLNVDDGCPRNTDSLASEFPFKILPDVV